MLIVIAGAHRASGGPIARGEDVIGFSVHPWTWGGADHSSPLGIYSLPRAGRSAGEKSRVQEQRLGKLGRETRKLLDRLARGGAEPVRHLKVGTVVVREHQGTLHEVGTAVATARSLKVRIKSTCPASERSAGLFGGETSTP